MSSENTKTKDRILEATWKLLEQNAASGVRMSDIAKEAKLSRQAVYLHFASRAELLVETTLYIDRVKDVAGRLEIVFAEKKSVQKLELFIEAWGNYMIEIGGVAKALLAMGENDEEAAAAWQNRMDALRNLSSQIIYEIISDKQLDRKLDLKHATDLLLSIISFRTWQELRETRGWSQKVYLDHIKFSAKKILLKAG